MQQNYIVYLELYGKKMKKSVNAESEADAISKIKNDIKIHKVDVEDSVFNNLIDIFFKK